MSTRMSKVSGNYLVLAGVLICFDVWAIECNSVSPYGHTPEEYFEELESKPITSKQYVKIKDLFQSMDDNWQGNGIRWICQEEYGELQKKKMRVTIKSAIDFNSNGRLTLENDVRSADRAQSYSDLAIFYLGNNYLRADVNNRTGQVSFVNAKKGRLSFVKRINRHINRAASRGRQVIDQKTKYTVSGKKLRIERIEYVNGLFTSETHWTLKPR